MRQTTMQYLMTVMTAICSLTMQAQADRFQCDESCDPDATGAVKYNVVSPVGFSTVLHTEAVLPVKKI